jgi:hypothetical protein
MSVNPLMKWNQLDHLHRQLLAMVKCSVFSFKWSHVRSPYPWISQDCCLLLAWQVVLLLLYPLSSRWPLPNITVEGT